MNCPICHNKLIDRFTCDFISGYCEDCKVACFRFSVFHIMFKKLVRETYYSDLIKYLILKEYEKEFMQYKFGEIQQILHCKLTALCTGYKRGICTFYQYNFKNIFEFYFCMYQKMILFNENDVKKLIKYFRFIAFFQAIKIKLNNIWNKFKKLFITEIKKQKE